MNTRTRKTILGILIGKLVMLLSMTASYAQLVLDKPGATGQYSAPATVTLTPGFTSTGNFHAFIAAASTGLGNAASGTQNYIQKTVYLRGFGNTPPSTLTVTDAMRDITYFDGLGRPVQEVGVRAAGGSTGRDITLPVAYDGFGRQDKDYLAYGTTAGVGGAFKANATTQQAAYYNAPPAGVVKIDPVTVSGGTHTPSFGPRRYEPSPLNRVLEQGFPGETWQVAASRTASTGRTVQTDFATNDEASGFGMDSRRVARYGVTLSAAGTPTLTLGTDAAYGAGELYVTITRDENWISGDGRNGTVEEYTDKQGRVVLKRTYNGGAAFSTYYVYNDFGQLAFVLTPGALPDRGTLPTPVATLTQWLSNHVYHYKYDERGRLVEKRIPGKGREFLVYNKLDQVVATQDSVQRMRNPQQWTVTKYDAHGRVVLTGLWTLGAVAGADNRTTVQNQASAQTSTNQWEERATDTYTTRAWPTGGITVLTEQFYDDYGITVMPGTYKKPTEHSAMTKGLPTASRVNVLGAGNYLWSAVYYDDRGNTVRQLSQHHKGGTAVVGNYDDVSTEYSFTRQVLASTRRHHASGIVSATVRTEHTYDHRDRSLDTWKTLNTGTRTLIARNAYNDVGQLRTKQLHSTNNGGTFAESVGYAYNPRGWLREVSSPKFRQTLNYEEGSDSGVVPYYNGNIAEQLWQHQGQSEQSYVYKYDKLNRLLSGTASSGDRSETLTYDPMGNISTLKRDASGPTLTYGYTAAGGNRLQTITGGTNTYLYDGNGNMTRDARQNRTITYNALNLPATISGISAAYTYDATGRKLRSVIGTATTEYIDGIEWEGTTLSVIHMEEGRILPTGVYEYVLKDHLGNTRNGFASDALTASKFQTDYYPFGLSHPGGVTSSPKNRYLYNGKELQDGSGYYDYGARFYDPVIGRWGVVDPLAEAYYSLTPYQYGGNTPVNTIDIAGKLFIFINGFDFGVWLPTRLPGSVPVQYGVYGSNFSPYAFSSMDRSISESDHLKYWGDVSTAYEREYKDDNSRFINASYTPRSSANLRYGDGVAAGKDFLAQLESGDISLADGETIKIVAHSQGAAYAAGMASVIAKHSKYGGLLEFVDYISPHQPEDVKHPYGVKGRQFSTMSDIVSSKNNWFMGSSKYGKIFGTEWGMERERYKGGHGGHSVDTWLDDLINYFRSQGITVNDYRE